MELKEILLEALEEYHLRQGIKEGLKELLKAKNERWITIHPHGDDSDDYRRLKIEDGETVKEAIERQYVSSANRSKETLKELSKKSFETMTNNEIKKILKIKDNKDLAEKIETKLNSLKNEYDKALDEYKKLQEIEKNWHIPDGMSERKFIEEFQKKYAWVADTINNYNLHKKNAILDLLRDGSDTFKIGKVSKSSVLGNLARQLQNDIKGVIGVNLLPKSAVNFHKASKNRAFQFKGELYLHKGQRLTTSIHEFMHLLEHNNEDLRQKSIRFLKYRTKDDNTDKLSDLYPEANYEDFEVVKKDNFFSPYCGKIYKNDRGEYFATEILSKGIEEVLLNGKEFYKNDPEYFNFVINAIKGKI